MAISTYTELKDTVRDYAKRGTSLDLKMDNFILLAEQEIYNNAIEPLEVKYQEQTATASLSIISDRLATPDGFESSRESKLVITDKPGEILFRTPERMTRNGEAGQPSYFTIIGPNFEFDRIADIAYTIEVSYFARIAALTSLAPTNTILTNYPDIYLFGTLAQAMVYVENAEREAFYRGKLQAAISGANLSSKKGRYGPAPVIIVDGPTP